MKISIDLNEYLNPVWARTLLEMYRPLLSQFAKIAPKTRVASTIRSWGNHVKHIQKIYQTEGQMRWAVQIHLNMLMTEKDSDVMGNYEEYPDAVSKFFRIYADLSNFPNEYEHLIDALAKESSGLRGYDTVSFNEAVKAFQH